MPASVIEEPTQEGNNPQEYKLLNKITSNPYVSSVWDSAKGYYDSAKERSSIAKYAAQTLESNLEKTVKWAVPKVEPVLQSNVYKRYEPLLHKADDFGCNQLDKIEKATEKLTDTYSSSKQMIEQKVTTISADIRTTTNALVDYSKHTIEGTVTPVDNYLRTSVIGIPIHIGLDITEKVCDHILPEDSQLKPGAGPIVRTTHLTNRITKEAFKQLNSLTLRTPEARDAFKFSVDLIQYAATQMDTTSKLANQYVDRRYKQTKASIVRASRKVVNKKNLKEAKEKITVVTEEAVEALAKAIDVLSKQVPQPVSTRANQTYSVLQSRTKNVIASLQSHKEVQAFSELALQSAAKLQEVSKSLAGYSQKQVESFLHTQMVSSVTGSLWQIIDNLLEEPKTDVVMEEHVADSASSTSKSDESFEKEEMMPVSEDDEDEDEISDDQEEQANAVEDE